VGGPQTMTETSRRRLFLAAALDGPTRRLLAAHVEAHGGDALPGRVVQPQNWHLTLRFLGWVTEPQRDGVMRTLDESALPGPFAVRFGGLGAFPKLRRATVLWLGIDGGGDGLGELAAAAEEAAQAVGYEPEDRPYHPHLTLSRIRPAEDVTDLVEAFPPFAVKMSVTAITLYESHLRKGGAVYEALDTVEL
jgi:2'-5' RNA ligase